MLAGPLWQSPAANLLDAKVSAKRLNHHVANQQPGKLSVNLTHRSLQILAEKYLKSTEK